MCVPCSPARFTLRSVQEYGTLVALLKQLKSGHRGPRAAPVASLIFTRRRDVTMLKKFLKFLKGTAPEHQFDGSYLDHLLDQVYSRAHDQLDDCPDHDPLLLVITEILRLTKPDQWTEQVDCPLADDQSPALAAPSPPPAPVDDVEGYEIVEASEVIEEVVEEVDGDQVEVIDEAADVAEASVPPQAPDAAPDDEPADAPERDEAGDEANSAPDDEASDDEATDDEASRDDAADTDIDADADEIDADADEVNDSQTVEVPPPDDAEGAVHVDDIADVAPAPSPTPPPRLDSSEVLQAGRIFLGLLIENDRLPLDMQLSVAETMLARDLLLGYFVQDLHFDDKAKELLALVEQKFNEGAFSQARILLQLFQTDRPTRVNNDRNLFYEDMILRLGIRRRHLINQALINEFEQRVRIEDFDTRWLEATEWLEQTLHIKFHLFTREPVEVERWRELAAGSHRQDADDVFLRYIPPKRWRPAHASAQTPRVRVLAHISAATVKQYIVRQIKACYFVLRAVGDTGLEPYLDVFFDWTEQKFDLNSVRLMPLLYRRTMSDTQLIDKIFEEAFRRFFRQKAADYLATFDEDAILEASRATLDGLAGLDFNRIPPGNYDLGGLILDRLFGLQYHEPEFAFKLHRLT